MPDEDELPIIPSSDERLRRLEDALCSLMVAIEARTGLFIGDQKRLVRHEGAKLIEFRRAIIRERDL